MGHDEGLTQPEAQAAGHLLALLDERDIEALVRTVPQLACTRPRRTSPGEVGCSRVFAWVITTIADVIIEPLQRSSTGTADSQITFVMFEGLDIEFIEAPAAAQSVIRAVAAAIAGDDATLRAILDQVDHADSSVRVDIMLEALALLDRLLEVRLHHASDEG